MADQFLWLGMRHPDTPIGFFYAMDAPDSVTCDDAAARLLPLVNRWVRGSFRQVMDESSSRIRGPLITSPDAVFETDKALIVVELKSNGWSSFQRKGPTDIDRLRDLFQVLLTGWVVADERRAFCPVLRYWDFALVIENWEVALRFALDHLEHLAKKNGRIGAKQAASMIAALYRDRVMSSLNATAFEVGDRRHHAALRR